MKLFYKYCKDVIKHTLNIYSLISFLLIFVTQLLPITSSSQQIIGISLAVLALLVASFFSWKDLYKKYSSKELSITYEFKTLSCGSVNGAGMIKSYSRAFLNIDFVNNTNDVIVVKKIVSIKLIDTYSLFEKNISDVFFQKADDFLEKVVLPIKVNANDRSMLQMVIHLPVEEKDPIKLPHILSKLNNLTIELIFSISNQHGENYDSTVKLNINTKEYIQEIIKIWEDSGYGDIALFDSYKQLTTDKQ